MDAGRDMNALVAEKVMRWTWLALPALNDQQRALVPPGFRDASPARWLGHDIFELVPAFSTDISAAWQVVEHMHDSGYHLVLWFDDMTTTGQWGARFCRGLVGRDRSDHAKTPALAICRAALAAVGVGVSV